MPRKTAAKKTSARKASARDASTKPWGKKELAYFEKRLLEERARCLRSLRNFRRGGADAPDSDDEARPMHTFHMADLGTDAMEREKAFLFASKEGRYLWHIDQALRRLYRTPEQFGMCQVTGKRIEFDRLDALPHARLSFEAKQREESGQLE